MVEAVQTTVSAAGIWAIVIVAVILLAFWLVAITLADRSQVRASGRAWMAGEIGSASNDPRAASDESVPPGEMPTRADIPAQPAAPGRPAVPSPRTGDADRAARSHAAPSPPDGEEQTPRP
jgi:hypothetical protein